MKIIKTVNLLRKTLESLRKEGKKIGFVPTMGALHEGHLSLIRKAIKENDYVVVSIFVNPTQFGKNEDLSTYPKDFLNDKKKLEEIGAAFIFFPEVNEIYNKDFSTVLDETELSLGLCGASRPGHFIGVATIVAKLFNIVQPDTAYFGQKDYQQLKIIQRMAADLNFPVKITSCTIVRDERGLALSSRNKYLLKREFDEANKLYKSLRNAASYVKSNKNVTSAQVKKILKKGFSEIKVNHRIDYIEIRDIKNLEEITKINKDIVILIAVFIGTTRLIDNIVVKLGNK